MLMKYIKFLKTQLKTKFSDIYLKYVNMNLKNEYLQWLFNQNNTKSKEFVALSDTSLAYNDNMTKLISFYLPQYYETEYNNKYFGKGFVEWYNVTKAIPQFTGHYQPHLPIDVGFYNLKHDDIMYRQIELAKKYGIYGFCFYYYWFSGDTLLEKPILNFLNNKELNFPFCLMWTNETWTSVWGDGNHKKIIKKQELNKSDDVKFANDIIKFFKDDRYITIDGKPLLIIYQSQFFPKEDFIQFIQSVKNILKQNGIEDVYILTTNAKVTDDTDLHEFDIEGVIEFSHQTLPIQKSVCELKNKFINPAFMGKILDIKKALSQNLHLNKNTYKTFRCIYSGWDNTPRKAYKTGCFVFNMGPNEFKQWLKDLIIWTKHNNKKEEQIIFINAWNEWAEGAHLEPDQKYGYAYLQAVKESLEETI